ncbi:MAG: hypothetical protein KAQ98_03285 [Bacteriovoracaceae bacterium]|nr:hypothetical protein [Bacteriovoracaceae bacterium]
MKHLIITFSILLSINAFAGDGIRHAKKIKKILDISLVKFDKNDKCSKNQMESFYSELKNLSKHERNEFKSKLKLLNVKVLDITSTKPIATADYMEVHFLGLPKKVEGKIFKKYDSFRGDWDTDIIGPSQISLNKHILQVQPQGRIVSETLTAHWIDSAVLKVLSRKYNENDYDAAFDFISDFEILKTLSYSWKSYGCGEIISIYEFENLSI